LNKTPAPAIVAARIRSIVEAPSKDALCIWMPMMPEGQVDSLGREALNVLDHARCEKRVPMY